MGIVLANFRGGIFVKFFRKKTPTPTVATPAPLKVLEQSLTLADALLVYFETGGSYVRLRGALVQARRNQKDSGAALMSDEDLTGIRRVSAGKRWKR